MSKSKETAATKIFKLNVKKIAKEKHITISELCRKLRVNRSYLAHLTNPSLKNILLIAHAIGCTPAELLDGL